MREQRIYTQKQRDYAVQLLNSGHTAKQVADAMGVPEGTLYTWKSKFNARFGKVVAKERKKREDSAQKVQFLRIQSRRRGYIWLQLHPVRRSHERM